MLLLDGNVLVALAIDSHEFHKRAHLWFDHHPDVGFLIPA